MPCSSQKRPMAETDSAACRASHTASAVGPSFFSDPNFDHIVIAKPPLRPLAPPPQTSASSTTMSADGSSSRIWSAVHSPVNPPPTMQTSQRTSPASGGRGGTSPSASASHSERVT